MLCKSLTLLALSASAFATVFITSPTASTTLSGGKQANINWQDDGKAPSLKDFGPAKVSIYAGNAQQQTSLQVIFPNVDVSTTQSIQFTPDPSIGPNSNEYFIRVESLNLKDSAAPQYPALAFSAKFNMDGMTGQFSPAVLDQIKGQATAPLLAGATSTPAAAAASSSTPSATSKAASSTSSATKSAASAAKTSNAAVHMRGSSWFGIVFGAVVGAAVF